MWVPVTFLTIPPSPPPPRTSYCPLFPSGPGCYSRASLRQSLSAAGPQAKARARGRPQSGWAGPKPGADGEKLRVPPHDGTAPLPYPGLTRTSAAPNHPPSLPPQEPPPCASGSAAAALALIGQLRGVSIQTAGRGSFACSPPRLSARPRR